jgi:hypothetical protein
MIRRALYCTLTVLALGLGVTSVQADSTASPVTSSRDACSYTLSFRKPETVDWVDHRTYPTIKEATKAGQAFQDKGYEVQVLPRFALSRAPAINRFTLPADEVVSVKKAHEVFAWMARQKDIAYRYPRDGCYARAHLMIQRMEKQGFKAFKVWSFPGNGEKLQVQTANHPTGVVDWKYHVAPILRVRLSNGEQAWAVIDPSLFNGPVRIATWKNKQKRAEGSEMYVTLTRLGQSPKDPSGTRLPGSGYWPGRDPQDLDTHATKVMRLYKPWEGQKPPASVEKAVERLTLHMPMLIDRRWLALVA